MTRRAVVVEIVLLVIRFGCRSEITGVAIEAGTRRIRVSGAVTRNTRSSSMSAGENETGGTMIEAAWRPSRSRVTRRAVVVKIIRSMIWIGSRSKVSGVTAIALR